MTTQPKILLAQTTLAAFTTTVDGLVPAPGSSTGKYLKDDGTFATVVSGASISNDTSTNSTRYPLFADATTGTPTTQYTSDTKLYFNPSTGELSATGHTTLSDERVKYNIQPLVNSAQVINALNGKTFQFKDTNRYSVGLIAQEVERVLPEAVGENTDTGLKSVNYPMLVAHLVEYVKVLSTRIEELERRSGGR